MAQSLSAQQQQQLQYVMDLINRNTQQYPRDEMEALKRQGAMGSDFQPQVMNENRMPNSDINRYMELRNMANPNLPQQDPVGMPVDIDGASAGNAMSQETLNILLQQLQRMR